LERDLFTFAVFVFVRVEAAALARRFFFLIALADFEQHVWGAGEPKDSLDSIATVDKKAAKAIRKKNRRASAAASTRTKTKTAKVKRSRSNSGASKPSGGTARVSVRRQRH
jgi:hypothetical protein